jgi:iron(III) transport system substrate-binding protein
MVFLVLGLSLSLVLSGCGSSASPTAAPAPTAAAKTSAPAATTATTAAPSGATTAATSAAAKPADNTALIEAAKKEGSLNWIDGVVDAGSAQKMIAAFKKKYSLPDSFEVKQEQLGTGPLASRVQEEVKAGKITVDVFAIADPVLLYDLKNANQLLQYESPEYKNYTMGHKAGLTFEPGYWESAVAYCFAPITNPKFYSKPINSWLDLLSPDLKGNKIEWGTPASSQSQLYAYIALKNVLPATYFADVAKQQITSGTSSQQQTANIAQGQNLVTITNPFRIVQTSAQTGIALSAWFPKEGVPLMGHPYAIFAKAPHPNAAKLFIDWLYGPEGMQMYMDLVAPIMLRDGMKIPDSIKAYSPALSDIKAAPIDWKSLNATMLDQQRKESIQIFGK